MTTLKFYPNGWIYSHEPTIKQRHIDVLNDMMAQIAMLDPNNEMSEKEHHDFMANLFYFENIFKIFRKKSSHPALENVSTVLKKKTPKK